MSNNLLTLMDNFFDDYRPLATSSLSRIVSTTPALNIREYGDKYEISLTAAGIDPEKIKVELVDRMLNISYDFQEDTEDKKSGTLIRQEYRHYSFTRSVNLPKNVDESSVEAESEHGILKITVKKSPETAPKTVQIKIK